MDKVIIAQSRLNGKGLTSRCNLKSGEIIIPLQGRLIDTPTRSSLQIDHGTHIDGIGVWFDFLNHSCSANSFVDGQTMTLRARSMIAPGEEVTLNYCANEHSIAEPFLCNCGQNNCIGTVHGYQYLTRARQEAIKDVVAPFLLVGDEEVQSV